MNPPLDQQSPQPLYLQLAAELRDAIRRGDLKPSQRLPPERELVKIYNASRITVSRALSVLKAEALLGSGPGRGTFVRKSPPVRLPFGRFSRHHEPGMGPWETAARHAGIVAETRLTAVEQQRANADLAQRLGIEEGDPVILRSGQMLADDSLIQVWNAWYPLELVEGSELAQPQKIVDGAYAALDRIGHHPQHVTDEIIARAPTPEEATLLRLGTGVPVLTLTRSTKGTSGQLLEVLQVVANAESNVFLYEDLQLD